MDPAAAAQAAADAAAAAAAAALAQGPPAFRLGPAMHQEVLDLNPGGTGIKTYFKAILPLSVPFDGQPGSMPIFLASLSDRVNAFGMRTVLTMPDNAAVQRDLIHDYGRLSLVDVRTHAATYIAIENRMAQNSSMLYLLLADSMTPAFKNKVLLHVADFTIQGTPIGAALLKTMISQTYLDTRATTAHIRDTLVEAPQQMLTLSGNVASFNDWIRTQIGKLTARGETCQDILTYLWKAYQVAPDAQFRQYIRDRKNEHEDGRADITHDALMLMAEQKYQALIQSGEWSKPTAEQSEIVAMQAKLTNLNKHVATGKSKKTTTPEKNAPAPKKKGKEKGKGKDPKGNKGNDKPSSNPIPPWKFESPKSGESRIKVKDNKTYYWCLNHNHEKGLWVLHKPTDCKAKEHDSNVAPSLQQKAMQTIINFADDFEIDDEDYEDT
jgi:hypothetical protein